MSTYQDLEAKYETEETPESLMLRVHFPNGFEREHIGGKVEYDLARVRVHGERSLGYGGKVRFNTFYQVPEYCDIKKVKGKFDGKTVIITIPTIPGKVPKKEPQEPPKEPAQEAESNPEDDKQGAPTPTDDNQEKTKSTTESKKEADHETSAPPNATQEPMHQKGQEGDQQKATITKVESGKQVGQETSTPTKDTEESKSQKGQEGIPPKADSTKVCHDGSTSTPQEHTKESMPQKGKEETPPKTTFSTNAKLQGEEKFAEENDENEEKQKSNEKVESEDRSKKDLESGKAHEKDGVEDSPKREIKEESKGLGTFEGEKMNGKIGNDVGYKSDEKAMPESATRSRIKEVAASASQAVTSLAKRFNEEDKQRIIYMGAAVLVVALGVYATYKLRLRRP
ncbi:unnamed protein product [Sphenostylis stenocarpa]|uniref:SHSP domain-containing protein n=1 Tax=Sphenostylis stenocarpa TaxID=92480 RepID=A0AA86VZ12_9FABA|nr:unnamed protein product [Sphenostylis stenocarpa]